MLVYARRAPSKAAARAMLERAIADGSGARKLRELVAAQGGDGGMVDDPKRLPRATTVLALEADRTAHVAGVNAAAVGLASVRLGAGREKKGDPIDHATGVVLHVKVGDRVTKGQTYAELHTSGRGDAEATELVRGAFAWSRSAVKPPKLILGRIASG
jgi:pyrimidine-nucleoside phosphorylase